MPRYYVTRAQLATALAEASVLVRDSSGQCVAGEVVEPALLAEQLISRARGLEVQWTVRPPQPRPPRKPRQLRPLTERLFSRLIIDPDTGCLIWTGGGTADGYGQIRIGGRKGRKELVHRVMYRMFVDEIPEGMQLDHVETRGCVSRRCASPAHLEAVTSAENTRRGFARLARLKAEAAADA